MKYINKFVALVALLISVLSCNKEQSQEPTAYVEPPTQLLDVDITSEIGDAEARSSHVVTASGETGRFLLSDKPLSIRIAVRRGSGVPVYSTLVFKRKQGERAVRYVGQIKVPQGVGSTFQISAIILGEVGGRTYANLATDNTVEVIPSTGLVQPTGGNITTQIPYIAGWTPLSLRADGRVLSPVLLTFKPSGTLLRFSVLNDGEAPLNIKAIKVNTNAYVDSWSYDFTKIGTSGTLFEGQSSALGVDKTYALPATQTVAVGRMTPWYYIWVMPKAENTTTPLTTQFTLLTDTEEIALKVKEGVLPTGTVPVVLRPSYVASPSMVPDDISKSCFPDRKLPIEYVAHYNVNTTGTGFDETLGNNTPGTFTWDDARQRFANGITIGGKQYYLPSQEQMRAILPVSYFRFSEVPFKKRVDNEKIVAGGLSYTTAADYSRPNQAPILYALRLQHDAKCLQTAYRYEFVGDFVKGSMNSYLKITCRFLGKSYPWTIGDIDNEAFWAENTSKDIIRYFPASGETRQGWGANGSYWTSTATNPSLKPTDTTRADDAYFQNFRDYYGNTFLEMGGATTAKTTKLSVRLFGREVVTPASVPAPAR